MKKDDCIFCKLANGIIPTNSIYEDEDFKVILDMSPAAAGHALVLPKEHFDDLLEADEEVLSKTLVVAKKVGRAQKAALSCQGVNIVQNNGEAAGQTVKHLHIHVIPRYTEDGVMLGWNPTSPQSEELADVAEKLRGVF